MAYQKLKQSLSRLAPPPSTPTNSSRGEASLEDEKSSTDKLLEAEGLHEIDLEGSFIPPALLLGRKVWLWQLATGISTTLLIFMLLFWLFDHVSVPSYPSIETLYDRNGDVIQYQHDVVPKIYSPADEAVVWEPRVFHNNFWEDRTPWQGPPDDAVDEAWDSLYKNVGVIAVDQETADKLPNSTLPIPGTNGKYILGIEVFHQLHCLNSIRKALYPERYHLTDGMDERTLRLHWIHIEHCVDNIRQVIMCWGDTSTIPWVWNERHDRPAPDAHTTHVCRSFDSIRDWALQRSFTQEEYDERLARFGEQQYRPGHHHHG